MPRIHVYGPCRDCGVGVTRPKHKGRAHLCRDCAVAAMENSVHKQISGEWDHRAADMEGLRRYLARWDAQQEQLRAKADL